MFITKTNRNDENDAEGIEGKCLQRQYLLFVVSLVMINQNPNILNELLAKFTIGVK